MELLEKREPLDVYDCFRMSCSDCIYFQEDKSLCLNPDLDDYPDYFSELR